MPPASDGPVRLVLCGSSVSAMERAVLGYRSPLYGRRTGQLEVLPLPYAEARTFFPGAPEDRRIEFYSVLVGVPAYLNQFDPAEDALTNIERRAFPLESYLHREPRLLLLQEVREPSTYFSVLTALAEGATRFNEIGQRSGLTTNAVGKYLGVLQDLRFVRRELPATETRLTRRNSLYRLADPFFAFWFRFVAPWSGPFEAGAVEVARRHLREHFDSYVGGMFEEVCRQLVRSRPESFRGPYERVGAWWSGDAEIDLVGVDRRCRALLLGECKWTRARVGVEVLEGLRQLAASFSGWREVTLALFSKSGFTSACAREASRDTILVDLPRLRRLLSGGGGAR